MEHIYYDKEWKAFVSETYRPCTFWGKEDQKRYIGSFEDLLEVTSGCLDGVDFSDYDLSKIDISKYDLSNSVVPIEDQKKIGSFDDSFYRKNITALVPSNYEGVQQTESELVMYSQDIVDYRSVIKLKCGEVRLFYITDLHLDEKIARRFPEPASERAITVFISDIIGNLYRDYSSEYGDKVRLVIGGDVSHSFDISRKFYRILSNVFSYRDPLIILGNHELWDYPSKSEDIKPGNRLQTAILDYEKMFDELQLSFIHNMLYDAFGRRFVRFEELMNASSEEIRDYCNHSKLLILGGIGFSGKNDSFNFDSGMYQGTIISRDQEIEESNKFERLYNKMMETIPDIPIVVLTHMPKDCWTDLPYNPKWIYISGHDHKNSLQLDQQVSHYHDNQIGYTSNSIHLKSLLLSASYDIFRDYPDGIHEITRGQYLDFNHGLSIDCCFNRNNQLFMIKRSGLYCFLMKLDSGKLSILNGGRPKKLKINDPQYYYDNLEVYSNKAERLFSKYQERLKELSSFVKAIGGDGTIHGSIVDISYFSHLFLNPFDGSVIPYRADSIVYKTVYRDVQTLIENCERPLLKAYNSQIESDSKAMSIIQCNSNIKGKCQEYRDTWMYSCSYIFKGFQYLTDVHVIRIWKDELLNSQANDDSILEALGISGLLEESK